MGCKLISKPNSPFETGVKIKVGQEVGILKITATLNFKAVRDLPGGQVVLNRFVRLGSELRGNQILDDSGGCNSCGGGGKSPLSSAGIGNNNGPDIQIARGNDSPWEDSGIIQLMATTPSALSELHEHVPLVTR